MCSNCLQCGAERVQQVDEVAIAEPGVGFRFGETGRIGYSGPIGAELLEQGDHVLGTGQAIALRRGVEVVADDADDAVRVIMMGGRVAACHVGEIARQSMFARDHHAAAFPALASITEQAGAESQAKLERHVEAGQSVLADGCAREVVDGVVAVGNQAAELGEADVASVAFLERTSHAIA